MFFAVKSIEDVWLEDGRFIRCNLTKQSAYEWKKFWNDLWGDGAYDEELLCI